LRTGKGAGKSSRGGDLGDALNGREWQAEWSHSASPKRREEISEKINIGAKARSNPHFPLVIARHRLKKKKGKKGAGTSKLDLTLLQKRRRT